MPSGPGRRLARQVPLRGDRLPALPSRGHKEGDWEENDARAEAEEEGDV